MDSSDLTHLDADGRPVMVDVTEKATTARKAVAEGRIRMAPETFEAIRNGDLAKGSVSQVAELAGIMAGKKAGELIPLCHLLPETSVSVEIMLDPTLPGVIAHAEARIDGKTGVEMEALTAVSVSLLTVYDMAKAMDRGMEIEAIRLLHKSGGRSGEWDRV